MTIAFTVDALRGRPLACKTEIGDLEATLEVDEDVSRLQVEMDVARLVDELETLSYC